MAVKILCCHDAADKRLLKKLKQKLEPLEHKRLIKVYSDNMNKHLQTAEIILLLFSDTFIQSVNYYTIQQQVMDQYNLRNIPVIPVILDSNSWKQTTSFGGFSPLPSNGRPITNTWWAKEDDAFRDIVDNVERTAAELMTRNKTPIHPQFPTKLEDIESKPMLLEHEGGVWSIAFSPDGLSLASGGYNQKQTIKLWQLSTGKFKLDTTLIRSEHHSHIVSITFHPDGQYLASASDDKEIIVWEQDHQQWSPIARLTGHTANCTTVAISPDGKLLASGSADKTVKLWDLKTKELRHTLKGHSRVVHSVVFSPDGATLLSGSADKTINIWTVNNGERLHTLKRHSKEVLSLAISSDGKTLASGSEDKTIILWNLDTKEVSFTLKGHTKGTSSVTISPDGQMLASGSEDGEIRLWNMLTGESYYTLEQGHPGGIWCVVFSPNGQLLLSAGEDRQIKVWGKK